MSTEEPTSQKMECPGKCQDSKCPSNSQGGKTKESVSDGSCDYKKVKLSQLSDEDDGAKVSIFGWVTKCTPLKSVTFVELTSHFKTVKAVISGSHSITFSTSLNIQGTVKAIPNSKDSFTFEVQADTFEIYGGSVAPSFPLNKKSDKDSVLNYGHLAVRLPERALFLRARSELMRVVRDFYHVNSYTEVTPPTIVQTQVEGGSTLFVLDYYGAPAYLTQSSQLYLETVAPVAGSCFCIMPSYRAEKSKTSRHLSEYTHIEAELVDITFEQLMDSIEQLVRSAIRDMYKLFLDDLQKVYPGFIPVEIKAEPFKKITYKDAIKFFISKDHKKPDGTSYEMMDDICDASEKYLISEYGNGQPVFLTNFPVEHKPFYMRRVEGVTESCDLLFPGIGEIAGGSMRCDDYTKLHDGFKREGLDPKPYDWYLDMARYGPSIHGGYGIGFERLMMGIMGYKNVDEATLYPRKVSRCAP
ncbi:asparaginyl-tRNA synthetase [Pancytospora epiphaga]|nr:asparaginyl-tRNA synthetase [Pancytospora epiphaga]